jgi:hypothetical protein
MKRRLSDLISATEIDLPEALQAHAKMAWLNWEVCKIGFRPPRGPL